jgi:flavin reductase (DIM6/NTAB) family NADH-FMN oxidoreductase RutF
MRLRPLPETRPPATRTGIVTGSAQPKARPSTWSVVPARVSTSFAQPRVATDAFSHVPVHVAAAAEAGSTSVRPASTAASCRMDRPYSAGRPRTIARVEDLRDLMRRVPAPVSVLTFELDGTRFGVTVGSVVSLSLDPPLVGVSLGLDSSTHEPFRLVDRFALNPLRGDQEALAQHFARSVPPIVMWQGVAVRDGDGPPLLAGALGWIVCRTVDSLRTGDHTFFVGEALTVEPGRDAPGLAYARRAYHSV